MSIQGRFKIFISANINKIIDKKSNFSLVKNRLSVIKNYLIKNGIDENIIQEKIENEDFPDIISSDDLSGQIDQTIGIYVIKGDIDFKPYPLPLLQNIFYKNQVESAKKERVSNN
jgi:hypothetical protein